MRPRRSSTLALGMLTSFLACSCLTAGPPESMAAPAEPDPAPAQPVQADAAPQRNGTLAQFMLSQPQHRILHGWGQGIYRWDSEAVSYFREVGPKPVIFSGYMQLADPTRGDAKSLDQLQKIFRGWSSGDKHYKFVPLIGVSTHPNQFGRRGKELAGAFLDELGLTAQIRQRGFQNLTFSPKVFQMLSQRPAAWQRVYENLRQKGYDVAGLETLRPIPDEELSGPQQAQLAKLWDDVLLRANETLKARGRASETSRSCRGPSTRTSGAWRARSAAWTVPSWSA